MTTPVSVNLAKAVLTHHAKQRLQERFNVHEGKEAKFIRKWADKFEYVTRSCFAGESDKLLFSYRDWMIVTDAEATVIITVYIIEATQSSQQALRQFARQQITLSERQQNRTIRQLNVLRAKIERELSDRQAELRKARSVAKRIALAARIKALEARLADLPEDRSKAVRNHIVRSRGFARAL